MDQQVIINELDKRKETLDKMLAKFNKLKDEGKLTEAWQQLAGTLQYTNESLKYSAGLLRQIKIIPGQMKDAYEIVNRVSDKISKLGGDIKKEVLGSGVQVPKKPAVIKMIAIPRKQNIH